MNITQLPKCLDSCTIPSIGTLYVFDGIPGFNPQTLFDRDVMFDYNTQTMTGRVRRIEMYALKDNTGKPFSINLYEASVHLLPTP